MFEATASHKIYLVVVHHCDECGRPLATGVVDHRVLLQSGDTAGREDLVVLIHAERAAPQLLHR